MNGRRQCFSERVDGDEVLRKGCTYYVVGGIGLKLVYGLQLDAADD